MKTIGILYLILVVLLSALPCSDALELQNSADNKTTIISNNKEDCSKESCSPICLCSCCGQSVVEIEMNLFTVSIPVIETPELISIYNFKLENRSQNIWQPPKLIVNS